MSSTISSIPSETRRVLRYSMTMMTDWPMMIVRRNNGWLHKESRPGGRLLTQQQHIGRSLVLEYHREKDSFNVRYEQDGPAIDKLSLVE